MHVAEIAGAARGAVMRAVLADHLHRIAVDREVAVDGGAWRGRLGAPGMRNGTEGGENKQGPGGCGAETLRERVRLHLYPSLKPLLCSASSGRSIRPG